MKRTMLFAALASAVSLSAYGHGQAREQNSQAEQSEQQSVSDQQNQSQQSPDLLVKQAQQKLSADGKDVGPTDGTMGPKTQAALKEFQRENGLQQTGLLDQETIAALDLGQSSSAASGGTSPRQDQTDRQQPNDTGTDSVTGETQGSSAATGDTSSSPTNSDMQQPNDAGTNSVTGQTQQ